MASSESVNTLVSYAPLQFSSKILATLPVFITSSITSHVVWVWKPKKSFNVIGVEQHDVITKRRKYTPPENKKTPPPPPFMQKDGTSSLFQDWFLWKSGSDTNRYYRLRKFLSSLIWDQFPDEAWATETNVCVLLLPFIRFSLSWF